MSKNCISYSINGFNPFQLFKSTFKKDSKSRIKQEILFVHSDYVLSLFCKSIYSNLSRLVPEYKEKISIEHIKTILVAGISVKLGVKHKNFDKYRKLFENSILPNIFILIFAQLGDSCQTDYVEFSVLEDIERSNIHKFLPSTSDLILSLEAFDKLEHIDKSRFPKPNSKNGFVRQLCYITNSSSGISKLKGSLGDGKITVQVANEFDSTNLLNILIAILLGISQSGSCSVFNSISEPKYITVDLIPFIDEFVNSILVERIFRIYDELTRRSNIYNE